MQRRIIAAGFRVSRKRTCFSSYGNATDAAISDGIRFHDLEDFSLVICKPDRRIIYDNCQWSTLEESAEVGGMVLEKAVIYASHRMETDV